MSPRADTGAATHGSARDPTDTRRARAAGRPPRRWLRYPANTGARSVRASIQILSWGCGGHFTTGVVQLCHLVEQVEQVALPAFALAPHPDALGQDGDTARHPAGQLFHVEESLRVDADGDVVS